MVQEADAGQRSGRKDAQNRHWGCRVLGAGEHPDRCGGACPGLEGREGGLCLRSAPHSVWWVASFVS